MNKINLSSMTLEELKEYLVSIGEKAYRADQIFSFIHGNMVDQIDDITVLSKGLREKLNDLAYIEKVSILKRYDSEIDDTRKYLFQLEDGNIVEGVAMHYKHGWSVCISTQVGCKMGCSFCASTKAGLIRHLTAGEMAGEVYAIEKDLGDRVGNIVLMGSGEPLDNYDNVIKFFHLIHHEKGKNLSYRNLTLSTCGLVEGIYDLMAEDLPITLSISLHSPFTEERKEIMPITRRYSVEEVIQAIKDYIRETGRRVTIEYTLIENVNDDKRHADKLIELLKGMNVHINLIPLNPIDEYHEGRPSMDTIKRFKELLDRRGLNTTVRREMGSDIDASCGQLRRRFIES